MNGRRWTPVALTNAPPPAGAYSPAVRAGPFLFVAGQVPKDRRTGQTIGSDIVEQTRSVMNNVREVLEASGASLDDVVNVTVYLANPSDWGDFDRTYREFMKPPYPARAAVGAALRDILVEVSVVAYLG